MTAEAKKQTILSRKYLTRAVEGSYRQIGMSFEETNDETKRIIQVLSGVRDGVSRALESVVPGSIGKRSEMAMVCLAVRQAIDDGFERAGADLSEEQMELLKLKVSEERSRIKADIEEKFDLERDEKILGPGVDYMTCMDEALLQFMVYLSGRAGDAFQAMGAYMCGKCDQIHTKTDSDRDVVLAIEQFSNDAAKRLMDDLNDHLYRKKAFRFADLKKCFQAFLAKRRGNLKINYRLKGKNLESLRAFVDAVFREFESLTESDFLESEVPAAFSTIYGNTRAFYRKRVLDGMKERGLQNLRSDDPEPAQADELTDGRIAEKEHRTDLQAGDQDATVSLSQAAPEPVAVPAEPLVHERAVVEEIQDRPEVPQKSSGTLFERIQRQYFENPEQFAQKMAFFLCEPFYEAALKQGMYVCDHCKELHVDDTRDGYAFSDAEDYMRRVMKAVTALAAPYIQSEVRDVDFAELLKKVLVVLRKRLEDYRSVAVNSNTKAKKLKEQYLLDLIGRVMNVSFEGLAAYQIGQHTGPLFRGFQGRGNGKADSCFRPCPAGKWRDVLAEKERIAGQERVAPPQAGQDVPQVLWEQPVQVDQPVQAEHPVQSAQSVRVEQPAQVDQPVRPTSQESADDEAIEAAPATFAEDVSCATQILSDPSFLQPSDSTPPQEAAEITPERLHSILDWATTLPEMQKKNYIRYEIKALAHVLSLAKAYPKSLVTYAVLKLEAMRESFSFEDDQKSVNTRMGNGEILETYVDIFRQLRFELPAKSPSAVLVQERLIEFDRDIGALEHEYLQYEGCLNVEESSSEKSKLMLFDERAGLTVEKGQNQQKRAALKSTMADLLKVDLFAELRERNDEAAGLKARIDEIDVRLGQIDQELAELEKANRERQLVIGKLTDLKARLAVLYERRRRFIDSVRSVLERHKQQTISQSS